MVRKIQNEGIRTNDAHSVFYGLSIALFLFLKTKCDPPKSDCIFEISVNKIRRMKKKIQSENKQSKLKKIPDQITRCA